MNFISLPIKFQSKLKKIIIIIGRKWNLLLEVVGIGGVLLHLGGLGGLSLDLFLVGVKLFH